MTVADQHLTHVERFVRDHPVTGWTPEFRAAMQERGWMAEAARTFRALSRGRTRNRAYNLSRRQLGTEGRYKAAAHRLATAHGVDVRSWTSGHGGTAPGLALRSKRGERLIDAPKPETLDGLAVFAHECFHTVLHDPPMLPAGPRSIEREAEAWAATLAWWQAEGLPNPRRARDTAVQHLSTYARRMGHMQLRKLIADAEPRALAALERADAIAASAEPPVQAPGIPHEFTPVPDEELPCQVCGLPAAAAIHMVGGDSQDEEATLGDPTLKFADEPLLREPTVTLYRPLMGEKNRVAARPHRAEAAAYRDPEEAS